MSTALLSKTSSVGAAANIADIVVVNEDILLLQVKNTGANPITGFSVRGRLNKTADFVPLKSSGFATPDSLSLFATSEPSTLAAGASTILSLDVSGYHSVQINAASTAGTSLSIHAVGVK